MLLGQPPREAPPAPRVPVPRRGARAASPLPRRDGGPGHSLCLRVRSPPPEKRRASEEEEGYSHGLRGSPEQLVTGRGKQCRGILHLMLCQSRSRAPLGAGEEESTYCILTGCKSLQRGSKTSAAPTGKPAVKGLARDGWGDSATPCHPRRCRRHCSSHPRRCSEGSELRLRPRGRPSSSHPIAAPVPGWRQLRGKSELSEFWGA